MAFGERERVADLRGASLVNLSQLHKVDLNVFHIAMKILEDYPRGSAAVSRYEDIVTVVTVLFFFLKGARIGSFRLGIFRIAESPGVWGRERHFSGDVRDAEVAGHSSGVRATPQSRDTSSVCVCVLD